MFINIGFICLFIIHFARAIGELGDGFSKYFLLQLLVTLSFAITSWGFWTEKEWRASLAMGWAIAKCIIVHIAFGMFNPIDLVTVGGSGLGKVVTPSFWFNNIGDLFENWILPFAILIFLSPKIDSTSNPRDFKKYLTVWREFFIEKILLAAVVFFTFTYLALGAS